MMDTIWLDCLPALVHNMATGVVNQLAVEVIKIILQTFYKTDVFFENQFGFLCLHGAGILVYFFKMKRFSLN